MVNRKFNHLGCFGENKDAAKAYDEAATKHFGDFALTNKKLLACSSRTPERLPEDGPEEADEPGFNWHDSDLQESERMP